METLDLIELGSAKPARRSAPGSTKNVILEKDELELIQAYRRAKRMRFADINLTIQEGTRVKLWLTEKLK